MVTGVDVKYCHFCTNKTVHEKHEEDNFVFWVCQNPIHKVAQQQREAEASDPYHHRDNYLRGD